jgi:hypothetical protein
MRIGSYINKLKDATTKRDILHHAHIQITHVRLGDRTGDELIEMGVQAFAELQQERKREENPATIPGWPEPLHADAFHGVAGELVRAIEPESESDPAALLLQFVVAFGNMVGRGPYVKIEGDQHHTNEFLVLVGVTSGGRKGTSWGRIRNVMKTTDEHWTDNCLLSGLGSGEALIEALNDSDHRRLVYEPEFARVLTVLSREGTTLSSAFRQTWDSGTADIKVRGRGEVHVRGAHLSAVMHITRDELRRKLSDTELANGFANRFVYVCVARSKELPFGGDDPRYGLTTRRLFEVTDRARKLGNTRIRLDSEASTLWEQQYHDLTTGRPGLLGNVTARRAPHVLRFALIYALLDGAEEIRAEHLRAALAVWRYCEDSARYIFGDSVGDPVADTILRELRADGRLTRSEISIRLGRNKPAAELERGINVLIEHGVIRKGESGSSGGRPVTWYEPA